MVNSRKLELGNRNLIGAQVTKARIEQNMLQKELLAKLQLEGLEISATSLSLLEGQKRPVYDYELLALAKVLNRDFAWLFNIAPQQEASTCVFTE